MSNKKILSLAISGMLLISSSFSLEAKGMDKLSLNSTVGTNFIKNHKKAIIGTAVGALITSVITFVAVSAVKKTENINCNENDKKSDFKIQVSRHNNNKSTSESQPKEYDENIISRPVKGTSLEKITEENGQVYEDYTHYDTSKASDEDTFFSAEEWSCEEERVKETDQVHKGDVSHDTSKASDEDTFFSDEECLPCEEERVKETDQVHKGDVSHDTSKASDKDTFFSDEECLPCEEERVKETDQVHKGDVSHDTSEASDEDIFFSAEEWSCEEEIEKDTDQVHEDNVSHDTGENSGESLMLIDEAINEKFDQMFQKNGKTELFSICPIV